MNIYLVSQDENTGYDTYDSFVCYANTEEEARNMLPADYEKCGQSFKSWCLYPDKVSVVYLGIADPHLSAGVILASFNAG